MQISDWARQYAIDKAKDNMVATISVTRYNPVSLNSSTNVANRTLGVVVYTGMAHVHDGADGQVALVGDADVDLSSVVIAIPADSGPYGTPPDNIDEPSRDDVVVVTAHPYQPDLVGKSFRVLSAGFGGLMAAVYSMTCQRIARSRTWENAAGNNP